MRTELPTSCIYFTNLFNKTLLDSVSGVMLTLGREKPKSVFLFSSCFYNESQAYNDTIGW